MDIQTSVTPYGRIIYLGGHLDAATAPEMEKDVAALITPELPMIFDLSQVEYISSAGLRLFLIAFKQAARSRVPLVIASAIPTVQNIFNISGFSRMIKCYTTNEEAFAALSR